MFKCSHSKLKTWRRCHKAYDYKYIQKLRKRTKSKALYVGSMVHEAMEAVFKGEDHEKVFSDYQEEFNKLFDEERVELDGSIELSRAMVEGYFNKYPVEDLEVIDVEMEFEQEIADDIVLEGKIDLIATDKKGHIRKPMIYEHKTCAKVPGESARMSDYQSLAYWEVLDREGIKTSGVVWDYLRKKIPVVPEPLKSGKGLSKAKGIDTTYEVYAKAIEDNGFDLEDYRDILENLQLRDDSFFIRIPMPVNRNMAAMAMEDLVSAAKQAKILGGIATDRNLTRDCSWCDYYNLCQSEIRGLDTDFMIKKDFKVGGRNDDQKENSQ